jgi:hypothetical protein
MVFNQIMRFIRWLKYTIRLRRMKDKDPFIY